MQQILKKVIRTTSVTMCFSAAITMAPTFAQAHDGAVPTDVRVGPPCDICELQPVTGPCDGYFPRYYYDVDAGTCKEFIYGGCEGNKNNFQTLEKCEAKCGNPPR